VAGSVLLDVQRAAPATFSYLDFADTPGTGARNVRTLAGAPITMRNYGGPIGGPAREDDPLNLVTWLADDHTSLTGGFAPTPGREKVTVNWTTSVEADVDLFLLESGPSPSGPFTVIFQTPATGPGSYQYVDQPLAGNQTYYYNLSEHLTHGPVRLLASGSACPWSSALPASLLTVGASGAFSDIQAAVNTVTTGNFQIIYVAAGTYPSFTINHLPGVDLHLRIMADGSGPVTIDTSTGPVLIQNLILYDRIEITDVTIGSAGSPNPAVVILNSGPSLVEFDRVNIVGGTGQPGLRLDDSQRIAVHRSNVNGTPGVQGLNGSQLIISRGTLNSLEIDGATFVRTAQLTTTSTVTGGATLLEFPGVMPDIDAPRFQPLGDPFIFNIQTEPLAVWYLGVAISIDWYEVPSPAWSMVGLLRILAGAEVVGSGVSDMNGLSSFTSNLPPDKLLLGVPIPFQMVAFDPVPQTYRWSNVFSMIVMP
jgi:hypothetical protein